MTRQQRELAYVRTMLDQLRAFREFVVEDTDGFAKQHVLAAADAAIASGASLVPGCDVHLLTNGMLLDGEAARRLIDLGVTSVAFSLDGATAATNDAIRAGGRFEKILAHRSVDLTSPLYPLSYLGLARASTLAGDTARARKAYEDLFAVWKDADPDLPALVAARAEYNN